MKTKPRVLIADDHPLIVEGITRILEGSFEIVGSVADGHTLLEEAMRLQPDAILLDIAMPRLNGIEAARRLRETLRNTKIVVVSQQTDRQYLTAAFQAGATAYVLKQSAASDLIDAITQALGGKYYVSQAISNALPSLLLESRRQSADPFGARLTPRQREVLQLVAEGKSAKQIAETLKISPKTVEFHKASIMDQLGLRTTAELTRYAATTGIITL